MRTQECKFVLLSFYFLVLLPFYGHSQADSTHIWKGCISSSDSNTKIPFATIASFKRVAWYISDEKGCFELKLDYNDSIRISALGYVARTIILNQHPRDSEGKLLVELMQHSFPIKEVTVKGYRGILDPLIFPQLPDGSDQIDLKLPAHIGSQVSKIPPHERSATANIGLLGAIFNPVSFIHSFSRAEKSKQMLPKARLEAGIWNHRVAIAGREVIALISGFEGEELDRFKIYCNTHLKISSADNGATALRKIEVLLVQYQTEKQP